MNATAIIRAAIPDACEDEISHVVWGRTPYPFVKLTPQRLYKAASGWRRAGANGNRLCDHCDRLAVPGSWTCEPCTKALRSTDDTAS